MLEQARDYLEGRLSSEPRTAVVLGSGLGGIAAGLETISEIPYSHIPGWPSSTVDGHSGTIVEGRLDGHPLLVLSGRAHLYEGYSASQVVFGVRVLGLLGIRSLLLTNAAGGINPGYRPGALVLLSDHLNLQGCNPLTGPNDERLGPRFPDMSAAYSPRFRALAKEAAAELQIELPEGIYAALAGPSYETPAEIRYLRAIGADMVGMSTVPEAIAANHMGLEVLAISCITNMAAGILDRKIVHAEVLETGERARTTLLALIRAIVPRLP